MDNLNQAAEEFEARVRQELRSIPVPPGLKQRILAEKPKPGVIPWNFWKPALGIAATLALLATALLLWNRPPAEDRGITGFQNRMAAFAVRQYSMDLFTKDFSELRKHLQAAGAPADLELTGGLAKTPLKGGAKLAFHGRPVSMVCFEGPQAKTLYLFVVDSKAFPGPLPSLTGRTKGLSSALWNRAGKTYFLAAELPAAALEPYL